MFSTAIVRAMEEVRLEVQYSPLMAATNEAFGSRWPLRSCAVNSSSTTGISRLATGNPTASPSPHRSPVEVANAKMPRARSGTIVMLVRSVHTQQTEVSRKQTTVKRHEPRRGRGLTAGVVAELVRCPPTMDVRRLEDSAGDAGEAVAQGEAGAVHLRPSRRVEHLGKGRLLLLRSHVHVKIHPADHVARR